MKTPQTENAHLMDCALKGETLWMRTNHPTNHFIDAAGTDNNMNVPVVLFDIPKGDFSITCSITASIENEYDAAGFFLRCGAHWTAKFLAERAPTGEVMAVSVITKDYSDDCNGPDLRTTTQFRLTKIGRTISWHIPNADNTWRLARYAALPAGLNLQLGAMIQSPSGAGSEAIFSDISVSESVPNNLRDGS